MQTHSPWGKISEDLGRLLVTRLLLILLLLIPSAAHAGWSFRQLGGNGGICDGVPHEADRWTVDQPYTLQKARIYVGLDMYGTTDFWSQINWNPVAGGAIPLAVNMGDRAGMARLNGNLVPGSNFTDRFEEGLANVQFSPGDLLILYISCGSMLPNTVFGHPVSYYGVAGYLWMVTP